MYTMLYYPLVHPPKQILLETALYWDGLSSMTAQGVSIGGPSPQAFDLEILRRADLYRPIRLEYVLRGRNIAEIFDALPSIIEQAGPSPEPPTELNTYSRLWHGKLPSIIENELRRLGLAVPDGRQVGALRANPRLLYVLLSAMADYAAAYGERASEGRFVPTTTDEFAHLCATAPLAGKSAHSWMVDVGQALPIPTPDTPLDDVVAFRERYRDERERCIVAVRDLQGRLRGCTENPLEVTLETRRELTKAVTDLRLAGKENFKWGVKRTVWTTVAVAAGSAAGFTASAAGAPSISSVVAGAAATAAAGIATNIVSAPTRQRDDRFSYLHHLEITFPRARY